jgi:hypothetical protein
LYGKVSNIHNAGFVDQNAGLNNCTLSVLTFTTFKAMPVMCTRC